MERKAMLQWLIPAALAGLLIVLVAVLVTMSDYGPPPGTNVSQQGPAGTTTPPPITGDATGMSEPTPAGLPDLQASEWKPGPGEVKIWDVTEGEGDPVPNQAEVTVHYTGWLTNGKVFDSSVQRGESIAFPLDGVIRGWTEGIPGMKVGGIRRLHIPYDWAYGASGRPPSIPPKSDLVFEVKLLGYR